MKIVLSSILVVIASLTCYSQSEPIDKKLEFGFNLGVNRTNIRLDNSEFYYGGEKNDKFGFDLGVLMSYKPVKWLAVLPQAELSFNFANLQYNWTDSNGTPIAATRDELYPVSLGLKTHFHLILDRPKISPYIIAGPSMRFDLENEDDMATTSFKSPTNIALDFGVGFDSKLKHFKFSPEIVYSYGLINVNPLLDKTRYHKLSLVLNFKG